MFLVTLAGESKAPPAFTLEAEMKNQKEIWRDVPEGEKIEINGVRE
jgi:hypothetical protein